MSTEKSLINGPGGIEKAPIGTFIPTSFDPLNQCVVTHYHKNKTGLDDLSTMDEKKQRKIMTTFGDNLKRFRTEKNLSLRELAASADMEHKHIEALEKGVINHKLTTIFALAWALSINPSELIKIDIQPS